jgi:hypothetical protein
MAISKRILAIFLILVSIALVLFDGIGNHGQFLFRPHMSQDWIIWGLIILTAFIGLRLLLKRPPEITITNKAELIETMTRIVELLRDNGFSPQADAMRKPLQYLDADDKENFLKHLKTVDIWGGAGAAWEVAGFQTRQMELEFQMSFVKLVDLLQQTGIHFRAAASVANIFKRDIASRT